jgi:bifunctional non-homologous end joining protein LigD
MARKRDKMPHHVKPMLAKLVPAPFDRKGWIFEVKWDGYRAIAEIDQAKTSRAAQRSPDGSLSEPSSIRLYSRNGINFADTYPSIYKALKKIKHECVLDGEIIGLERGKPSFHALQQYGERSVPLQYVLFDILYIDGKDVRSIALVERKKMLRTIVPKTPELLISEHIEERGLAFFKLMQKKKIEGMVAKDGSSSYIEGARTSLWLKIKNFHVQEAIIVGFTQPRGTRKNLGALVLGAYDAHKLTYIGHSGGGFTQIELQQMCRKLKKIAVKKSPLDYPPDGKVPINSPITWVRPHYVCEVQFGEWTPEGRMRHPIYKGLRIDKHPKEVVKEIAR